MLKEHGYHMVQMRGAMCISHLQDQSGTTPQMLGQPWKAACVHPSVSFRNSLRCYNYTTMCLKALAGALPIPLQQSQYNGESVEAALLASLMSQALTCVAAPAIPLVALALSDQTSNSCAPRVIGHILGLSTLEAVS